MALWQALLTLSVLEIVLGIDNIIFISIVAGKLPKEHQKRARTIGLMLALVMRVALLFSITWVISMKGAIFHVLSAAPWFVFNLTDDLAASALWSCSGCDLILLCRMYIPAVQNYSRNGYKIEGR
ncbi:MAG: hypothetical protein IPL22_04550 [Bacteroidetes bacterium]|nr:hypothetical protein [Bacteroidota bacterium]